MDISRASQHNINHELSGDLNFDILFHVMHELHSRPYRDLLSLMKTCKTLYHYGIPLLLSIPIDFAAFLDSNQLRFLQSLQIYLEKHPSRLQFIEDVTLPNAWGRDPKMYHCGVHVFKMLFVGCHNLKKLEYEAIETYRDDKRYPRRRLLPMGHTFNHLQSLTITRLGPDTCQMLKSLKAPIVYLSLCYDYDFSAFRASDDFYPKNPVPLLVNFLTTLEELTLYWCQWDDRWEERNKPLSQIRCLKVHTLKTNNDSCPDTATLMYVFPNLKHLQVQNESGVTFHEENVESQAALAPNYHWQNLETVSADINSLYNLALSIKVNQLDTDCGPTTFLYLYQVLKQTKPTLLKLHIGDPNPIFDSDMDKAREMLHYEELSRLWLKITLFGVVRGYKVILTNEMVSKAIVQYSFIPPFI
ncbi:hypothetical protein C8Q75DRAFT_580125 [Abortiporus biennis]|nr:hypothetical protein C8Q75DRAFT_580125 [Abortiporus biennis]